MSNADVYYNAAMIDRLTAAACENAELKAERDRLRELLQEIYDWTAYKNTEWAKKTRAALQEGRDD